MIKSSIACEDLTRRLGKDASILIDVRETSEYAAGHAEKAESYPLSKLPELTSHLGRYSEIYVMCQTGGRSALATKYLRNLGMNAIDVEGGLVAWKTKGLPISK